MATKSDQFKAMKERSGPKRAKAPKRPRRDTPVDTAAKGVSATDRKAGKKGTASRNQSARAAKKAEVVLEDSETTPSRKSTRKSLNRGRVASSLERSSQRKARKPGVVAVAAQAKSTQVRGRKRS